MIDTRRAGEVWGLESLPPAEYSRLVRLCASLAGDHQAAEDLAQETLLEAWRQAHKVIDPAGYAAWLAAIARNVCLRWRRRRGREAVHLLPDQPEWDGAGRLDREADDFDLEVELEQHELAELLDRAMALLPPATRALLVERYIRESPQAEIARRLGLSEGAVEARLHRGRLALRRVLSGDLRPEAAAYGLSGGDDAGWQATRIWCPFCGDHKLVCRLDRAAGRADFHCPGCAGPFGGQIASTRGPAIIQGVSSFKAILTRQITWLDRYYRQALAHGTASCPYCRHTSRLMLRLPDYAPPAIRDAPGMYLTCPACGITDANPLRWLVLDLPETQRFWRRHPRMRVLPDRAVEVAGRPVLVTTFASTTGAARLDVISAADTLAVLGVHGAPDR